MQKGNVRFRQPTADEQTVLLGMGVKLLVRPQDIQKCDQLLIEHHYLHSAQLVGEQLRYAVSWKGRWFAVATWSAAALHLKARDQFIGWTEEQRRQRLPLVVNNSRLYVLPECHYPNLVSRFMKLMLARLSSDWESTWGHPVALAESFVDPQQYRGTAYKVSGWSQLGLTRGWKRSAVDFYEQHGHPKQVWVRELVNPTFDTGAIILSALPDFLRFLRHAPHRSSLHSPLGGFPVSRSLKAWAGVARASSCPDAGEAIAWLGRVECSG